MNHTIEGTQPIGRHNIATNQHKCLIKFQVVGNKCFYTSLKSFAMQNIGNIYVEVYGYNIPCNRISSLIKC